MRTARRTHHPLDADEARTKRTIGAIPKNRGQRAYSRRSGAHRNLSLVYTVRIYIYWDAGTFGTGTGAVMGTRREPGADDIPAVVR
jgi:hypothetical protein